MNSRTIITSLEWKRKRKIEKSIKKAKQTSKSKRQQKMCGKGRTHSQCWQCSLCSLCSGSLFQSETYGNDRMRNEVEIELLFSDVYTIR